MALPNRICELDTGTANFGLPKLSDKGTGGRDRLDYDGGKKMQRTKTLKQTKELTWMAMFIAMITVGAWISLPIGLVSVTMQTLMVMLAGLILPRRMAIMAVSGYLLLGLLGAPVFAGGVGGVIIFSKPSFGFLLGFLPLVWLSGTVTDGNIFQKVVSLLAGNGLLYGLGFSYMYAYFNFFTAQPMVATRIFQIGILPYLPGDILKIGIAVLLAEILKKSGNVRSFF